MATALSSRVQRVKALARTAEFKRLLRYATVSAVTTVISLGMLYVFFRVLKVGSAARANILATAIATVPSYYFNRTWAWGKSGKSHLMREVIPFWVIAFVSLVLSTLAVGFAAHEAHHITRSHTGVTVLVELANLFTYGVLWIGKYVLFTKVLFTHPKAVVVEGASSELDDAIPEPFASAESH